MGGKPAITSTWNKFVTDLLMNNVRQGHLLSQAGQLNVGFIGERGDI